LSRGPADDFFLTIDTTKLTKRNNEESVIKSKYPEAGPADREANHL
jgi:hypothetical protein